MKNYEFLVHEALESDLVQRFRIHSGVRSGACAPRSEPGTHDHRAARSGKAVPRVG